MRRNPTRVVLQPAPPPVMPTRMRPSRADLMRDAAALVRQAGPPGTARDFERTAQVLAMHLDACWDCYERMEG
jgi:hypothetical protein